MSDFLARLAARALGQPPALVPVVASRWEAAAGEGAPPGFTEAAEERAAPPLVPARGDDAASGLWTERDGHRAPSRRRSPAPPVEETEAAEITAAHPPHPSPVPPPSSADVPRGRRVEAEPTATRGPGETPPLVPRRVEPRGTREPGPPIEIEEVVTAAPPSPPLARVQSAAPTPPARTPRTTATSAAPPALPAERLLPPRRESPAAAVPPGDRLRPEPDPARQPRPAEAEPIIEETVDAAADPRAGPRVRATARRVERLEEDEGTADDRRAASAGRGRGRAQAAASATAGGGSADEPADAEEEARPVIRVTIGRIEVRAAPPPAPPRPAAAGWTPPVMSLDEYLEREGRR